MSSFRKIASSAVPLSQIKGMPSASIPNASAVDSLPPGVKRSTGSSCYSFLTSSGIATLDELVGNGGIPLSSMMLIKEDRMTSYAKLMLSYFACQGLACGQHVIMAGDDGQTGTDDIQAKRNSTKESDESNRNYHPLTCHFMDICQGNEDHYYNDEEENASDEKMKIAWRYQSSSRPSGVGLSHRTVNQVMPIPTAGSEKKQATYCYRFDITKKIDPALLTSAEAQGFLHILPLEYGTQSYQSLLDKIKNIIQQGGFSLNDPLPKGKTYRPVLRIAIQSVGTPFWGQNHHEFYQFMFELKHIVASASACCMVSMPAYLYGDHHSIYSDHKVRSIERLADCVLEIESFQGTPRTLHPAYLNTQPAYHGLIHLIKLYNHINTGGTLIPPCYKTIKRLGDDPSLLNSLAFRVRRKRFLIETFHLPPADVQEEESKERMEQLYQNMSLDSLPNSGCGGQKQKPSKLDF